MSTEIHRIKALYITRHGVGNGKVAYNFRIEQPFVVCHQTLTTDETKSLIEALQNSIKEME